jgi:hypothetical protein
MTAEHLLLQLIWIHILNQHVIPLKNDSRTLLFDMETFNLLSLFVILLYHYLCGHVSFQMKVSQVLHL